MKWRMILLCSGLFWVAPHRAKATGGNEGTDLFCTMSPEGWQKICQHASWASPNICQTFQAKLPEEEAHLWALNFNIDASDSGRFRTGLGDLHFAHGARAEHSVRTWRDLAWQAYQTQSLTPELLETVRNINENYDRCQVDLGALAPLVTVPRCYSPKGSVTGPQGTVCAALDSECGRGVFDPQKGCCAVAPRQAGLPCAAGGCGGEGVCVPGGPPVADRDEDGIADKVDPVVGRDRWVESPQSASAWIYEREVQLFVEEELTAGLGLLPKLDLSKVFINTIQQAELRAVLLEAPGGARWVELALDPQGEQVLCVIDQPIDGLGLIDPECARVGAMVPCPGEANGLQCTLDGGRARVKGEGMRIVFQRLSAPIDLHAKIMGSMRTLGPSAGPLGCGECTPGAIAQCPGTVGRSRWCLPTGCWTPCSGQGDRCDGQDNDGDGVVDEDGAALCSDGLACTLDICQPGPRGTASCAHLPIDQLCNNRRPGCVTSTCLNPPAGAQGSQVVFNPQTGCQDLLSDNYCTNVWDSCDCNGTETCAPNALGADAQSGCIFGGAPPPCQQPPANPADLCQLRTCCESNPSCQFFANPGQFRDALGGFSARTIVDVACGGAQAAGAGFTQTSPTGGQVFCMNQTTARTCDDRNPCTQDVCNPATGLCSPSVNLPDRSTPQGCSGLSNFGCGSRECQGGTCQSAPLNAPFPQCEQAPPLGCTRTQCVGGACVVSRDSTLCDDNNICNGTEVCNPNGIGAPVPGGPAGCRFQPSVAFNDGIDCTEESCDPQSQTVQSVPNHALCEDPDEPCGPRTICDPDWAGPSGCVEVGPRCDDGDACTVDTCYEDFSFEFPSHTCAHENVCLPPAPGP